MPGSRVMSLRRFLLATAFAAVAATASADVTLLAPRAGDRLDGGAEATLLWSATSLPAHADEWEAFLSLDGGAYYAVRITPHLDAGIRTFRWRVPNVATSRARLLLRVGDESDEHLVELPQTFSIVPRYAPLDFVSFQAERGEAAIEGGEGSVEWVSGDRSGAHLVRHQRRESSAAGAPAITCVLPLDAVAAGSNATPLRTAQTPRNLTFQRDPPRRIASTVVRPLLLLSTRLNV